MVQSLKTRDRSLFCLLETCKANFKSFLLLIAEKKGSVRTRSGTACEQGGKGLVDHSEACQWAEVSLVVFSSVSKHSDEKSWLLSLRNWHGQGADIIFGLKWPQHIATCKYNFAGLSYCRMNECTHSSQVQSWMIYGRGFMPSCAALLCMHYCVTKCYHACKMWFHRDPTFSQSRATKSYAQTIFIE